MERFEKIVQAAEDLLQTANIEDISFYDIARQAQISPPSIAYLFPTMAALRTELSRRYLVIGTKDVVQVHQALAQVRNPSWRQWVYEMGVRARDYYNDHRHVSEVVLGPMLHRETRRASFEENKKVAHSLLESFKQVFIVPEIPGLTEKFAVSIEIVEALWGRSYILNGTIDDDSFEESMRIQFGYLRSILPETLAVAPESALD